MLCPYCQQNLKEVSVYSHHSLKPDISIDQCENCGGIWFDSHEIHRVRKDEVKRIDAIDTKKLAEPKNLTNKEMHCPHDNNLLRLLSDHGIPKELQLIQCPDCRGLWLNRGEFTDFHAKKTERLKQMSTKNDTEFTRQLDRLLSYHDNSKKYETIGNFGKFLSTPMYQTNNSLILASSSGDKNALAVAQAVMTVLAMLLKLLLKI